MHPSKRPVRRRDAPGHLHPDYARDLLARAREYRNEDDRPDAAHAFISGALSLDPLAEELAEAFLEAATSGEETERRDRVTTDEYGGPFVYTSGPEEFAFGPDRSNTAEATREPLPRTCNAET